MAAKIGLSYNRFKNFTPRDFRIYQEAYYDRLAEEIDRDNLRAGTICATIMNIISKRKFKPSDFFKKTKKPKSMSAQQMADIFKCVTVAMGGVVKND
jgi:hypothetical protein